MAEGQFRVTRRDMLRGAGAAALAGALTPAAAQDAQAPPGTRRLGPGPAEVEFVLNGRPHALKVEPRVTLLDALRDHIGLTGAKRVCDRGACGGCTVHVDGRPVNACMMLAVDVRGAQVRTIEGLATDKGLHPVQEAFVRHDAFQCGFCAPGMVMSCVALLEKEKKPTDEQIRAAVAGNLCRCGTYTHVLEACREASR